MNEIIELANSGLKILNIAMIAVASYYLLVSFVRYDVKDKEMYPTIEECPKCAKYLKLESGEYANTYRCLSCGFEGSKDPFVYTILQAIKVRKNRVINQ